MDCNQGYIQRLQNELAAAKAENQARRDAAYDFLTHLAGAKFNGEDADGARKDWIAVGDVRAWMARILEAGA